MASAPRVRLAEQLGDGIDGRSAVVRFDDCVEYFVAALERGEQRVGDVTSGGGLVQVGHKPIV